LSRVDGLMAAACSVGALVLALGGGLYIVPKLARRVQWEFANNLSTRTTVTGEGLIFLSVVVVIGVAAWNTENNLLYLILAAMLAFVVASGTVARQMLRDVAVKLRFPDYLWAGEPVRLAVTLVNEKAIVPSCSISVEAHAFRAGDDTKPSGRKAKRRPTLSLAHFISIPPRSSARQVVEHTFERRGLYRIDGFSLATRFPSGFFRKIRLVRAEGEIVVFPPVLPVDDFFHSMPMLAGTAESLLRGEGVDLYSLRDYRPTDHMRHIDWKASAKTRRLTVRETLREEERRLSIFFDPTKHGHVDAAFDLRFERAVELAASLAQHFMREGAEVELVAPASVVGPGQGREHLYRILASLAVLMPVPAPADDDDVAWDLMDLLPGLGDDHRFKVLITAAPKGSIPARVWRTSHVVFIDDLDPDAGRAAMAEG
jgi:uncharacterized protein (DUF58 family)